MKYLAYYSLQYSEQELRLKSTWKLKKYFEKNNSAPSKMILTYLCNVLVIWVKIAS